MHTPGPWNIEPYNIMQRIKAGQATVALPCMNDDVSAIQCGANARLIAAAPDLLAALRAMLDDDNHDAAKEQARAAIARATGKE